MNSPSSETQNKQNNGGQGENLSKGGILAKACEYITRLKDTSDKLTDPNTDGAVWIGVIIQGRRGWRLTINYFAFASLESRRHPGHIMTVDDGPSRCILRVRVR
uniref:BHLH domain-containing protein n=1 Tax=Anopheles culicifacies TaxID=139723 RepID=A0A182MIX9_9DIPT